MAAFIDQFDQLHHYAYREEDVLVINMLEMFYRNPGHWKSWDEFLVCVIMQQSAVNKDLRKSLVDAINNQQRVYHIPLE